MRLRDQQPLESLLVRRGARTRRGRPRSVAAELGVEPMSLYRQVDSGDDLFDAMVDRIVDELNDDPKVQTRPTDGWRPFLDALAWLSRPAWGAVPGLLSVRFPGRSPNPSLPISRQRALHGVCR